MVTAEMPESGAVLLTWLFGPDHGPEPGSPEAVLGTAVLDPGVLDPGELRRAAGFRHPADRDRYLRAHVGLRRALARCLAAAPADLVLIRLDCPVCGAAHGRPAVADHPELHFSLSYADDAAVCAVASAPVGVDLETVRTAGQVDAVRTPGALRKLHPDEQAAVRAQPEGQRQQAFLSCWVRKEAYLKGTGAGLAGGLGTYVGLADRFGGAAPDRHPPGWRLADLDVPAGYQAAVAVRVGTPPRCRWQPTR